MNTSQPSSPRAHIMGIDLGGTSIKIGLLRQGQVVARTTIQTSQCDTPADAFRQSRSFAEDYLHSIDGRYEDLSAVGLAMAGVIDEAQARLMETANLHAWHGIGFQKELADVFEKPVAVINDANAAALGEAAFGQHRSGSLAFLTLGTGVGGGIIVHGRAINGSHGCGGEIGHATIDFRDDARVCGCGRPGHLEAYAGAAGIVQTARELITRARGGSVLAGQSDLSPAWVATAAESGDEVALETVRRTGKSLGRAVAMLMHIADPQVVLLGGAVTFGGNKTQTGRLFLNTIHEEAVRFSLDFAGDVLKIEFASLGNDAGMLGAARHAELAVQEISPAATASTDASLTDASSTDRATAATTRVDDPSRIHADQAIQPDNTP